MSSLTKLKILEKEITNCRRCPRLVEWREASAQNPPRRYAGQEYWAKPVPGWGDPEARLLIVGLAPAANGANRTGRMFTGDKSGDWLYRALWKAGFASAPVATGLNDGLRLHDCYITAPCRCAPPQNKPLPSEMQNCRGFLERELALLTRKRVLLSLGKIGFDATFRAARELHYTDLSKRPKFAHGAVVQISDDLWLLGSYHPSQQNTFTGVLTEPMFDSVFARAKEIINNQT